MSVAALIPARKGSKGLPNKNLLDFCGKPLISWTIEAAEQSGVFDKIIVSTDYSLSELPSMNGITIYDKRPKDLCRDRAPLDKTLVHCLKYEWDEICLLQPTSVLRDADDIREAYEIFKHCKRETLISVAPQYPFIWVDKAAKDRFLIPIGLYNPQHRPNRQERKDWYFENGAIYFTKRNNVMQTGCRISGTVKLFPMPVWKSIEIDSEEDLVVAKGLYEYRNQ